MKKFADLKLWLPALLWTALIFTASSDSFSAEHTGIILRMVLAVLVGTVQPPTFALIHFLVRKAAHFTEYSILAWLYFRAWRSSGSAHWSFAWARQALAVCMSVAALDEFHQSFVPSRTSSPIDVAIDTAGALVLLLCLWLQARMKSR
jgi:VanZ family protein